MFVNHLNIAHHKSYHIDGTILKKFDEMKRRCGSNRPRRISSAVSALLVVYAKLRLRLRFSSTNVTAYVNAPAYRISLERSRGTTTT